MWQLVSLCINFVAKCTQWRNIVDAEIKNCSSVQELLKFKVEILKSYLRDHALNLSGDKQYLAEKVFSACKLKIRRATSEQQDDFKKRRKTRTTMFRRWYHQASLTELFKSWVASRKSKFSRYDGRGRWEILEGQGAQGIAERIKPGNLETR